MTHFSLIIATLGRTDELNALLASVAAQQLLGVECIVVDQNEDRRLDSILERYRPKLEIRHVRTRQRGLSRARNLGLQFVRGRLVAFPDDDCTYPEGLLASVSDWFLAHSEVGILTVGAEDRWGQMSGNRWLSDSCAIDAMNAFRTTFSSTIFARREVALRCRFDEQLGVGAGTPHTSGEETDYVLQLMALGVQAHFDRSLHIIHPKRDMLSGHVDGARATGYGSGMGYVLRKNKRVLQGLLFLAYDLARCALVALRGDGAAARLCLRHGLGIAQGLLASGTPAASPGSAAESGAPFEAGFREASAAR